MNAKTFFGGAIFGALLVLTFAAADDRTSTWEYKAQMYDLGYGSSSDVYWTKALNDVATNAWEVVCSRRVDYRNVEIVLKRPK